MECAHDQDAAIIRQIENHVFRKAVFVKSALDVIGGPSDQPTLCESPEAVMQRQKMFVGRRFAEILEGIGVNFIEVVGGPFG